MLIQIRHMVQQYAQAGNILRVMLQDVIQQGKLFCFQIGKVPLGYFTSGNVIRPRFAKDHFLQPAQVAPAQPELP